MFIGNEINLSSLNIRRASIILWWYIILNLPTLLIYIETKSLSRFLMKKFDSRIHSVLD